MECDPRNNHHPIPFPLSQLLLTKSQNNCRPRLVIQVRPIQVRAIHLRPPLSPLTSTSWSILTGSSLRNCNPPSTAPKQAIGAMGKPSSSSPESSRRRTTRPPQTHDRHITEARERFSHPSHAALQSKAAEIHMADDDMADETPATPPVSPAPPEQGAAPDQPIPFDIGEEFGTAKRNLPPAKVVAIVLGVAAVIVAVFAFVQSAKPQGGGSIDNISAVEIPDQNAVLVALNVTIHNSAERPLWIHTIKATLKTDSGEFGDDAASSSDFARYFQAFPALKEHALSAALVPEEKIQPGAQAQGTIVVSFPVTQDAFEKRKSLTVSIQPYDQAVPLVLTK